MKIGYRLFNIFERVIRALPFSVLYLISDFTAAIVYYFGIYRKKITISNLSRCFPQWNQQQVRSVALAYYRNIFDIILEVIKLKAIGLEGLRKRFIITNPEVLSTPLQQGKSVILLTGHLANWEWMIPALGSIFPPHPFYVVAKRLKDPFFDAYISKVRGLMNPDFKIPFRLTLRYMIQHNDTTNCTIILADQTPHRSEIRFIDTFFGQPTPFFTGYEKIAVRLTRCVIFAEIYRLKRGHYAITFYPLSDKSDNLQQNELVRRYIRLFEDVIRRHPDQWTWSHRRWKYMNNLPKFDSTQV